MESSHLKSQVTPESGMCVPIILLTKLNPPVRGKHLSSTHYVVANPATHFSKEREAFGRNACVLKCWRNCQLASFEALLSVEKKPSTIQRHRGARSLFASCRKKRYPSNLSNFHVFTYHIGQTCLVKEIVWSRNCVVSERCIFLGPNTVRPKNISELIPAARKIEFES